MNKNDLENVSESNDIYENELFMRKKKLRELRKNDVVFPNDFRPDKISSQLHAAFDKIDNKELKNIKKISVAGRIIQRRIMGKASFIVLKDIGGYIQLYITSHVLTLESYENFKKLDIGDIIGARGHLFKTKTNELSIYCSELCLLTKSIRPLPEKFHGLHDKEICYRRRYLDLITNEKSRNVFKTRSKIISVIRNFMLEENFMEVETPMMQIMPGGATAKPFLTHYNALNQNIYLRISPELYLKQLVIGGFEKIFEINRNFRNEGISHCHNPEFTMMELYMTYKDYKDLMFLIEKLFSILVKKILGSYYMIYKNYQINFSTPFQKFSIKKAILKYVPQIHQSDLENHKKVFSLANSLGLKIQKEWSYGHILLKIFEKKVESNLIQPTFITDYPVDISPLARRNDNNPNIADRFEFFIGGYEIGNGFSELNDPEDQKNRFIIQNKNNTDIDKIDIYDQEYIFALEHGMPPTAGLGIGIDRVVMLLTNTHSIRDVILFPILRSIKNKHQEKNKNVF